MAKKEKLEIEKPVIEMKKVGPSKFEAKVKEAKAKKEAFIVKGKALDKAISAGKKGKELEKLMLREEDALDSSEVAVIGIKESLEFFDFVCSLSAGFRLAAENGTLEMSDIQHAIIPLTKSYDAFKDITKMKEEMANLDSAEIALLVEKLIQFIDDIVKAIMYLKK